VVIDVEKEVELYQKELNEGKFRMESLKNNTKDYSEENEYRDGEAFKTFLKTDTCQEFMEWAKTK
jgi:hypothetical protein